MVLAAGIVFGVSLFGIVALFALKRYEYAHQKTVGGAWKAKADIYALEIKRLVMIAEWYLSRTPRIVMYLTRKGIRAGALGFARLARALETRSHELADMVSHKRNFERRETRSQFLKEVSEYKNGHARKDDEPLARV